MTRDEFTEHAKAFSSGDYEGYSKFYTDDVVLELGSIPPIRGRQGIVDFYREMNKAVRERLTVHQVVMDENGIAADVSMEFTAHEDAPDFVVGPLKKGQSIKGGVFAFYTLRDGKIASIRTARSRPIQGPA